MAEPADRLAAVNAEVPLVIAAQDPDNIFVALRPAATLFIGDLNRKIVGDGLMVRKLITKASTVTLVADEVKFAMVKTSAVATLSLPTVTAALEGADVIIASADNHSTIVDIDGGANFGNGTATQSDATLTVGVAGHFYCDGVNWYAITAGVLS